MIIEFFKIAATMSEKIGIDIARKPNRNIVFAIGYHIGLGETIAGI